jgi:hypothetical protein
MGERSGTFGIIASLVVVIIAAIAIYFYYGQARAESRQRVLYFSGEYRGLVERNATFHAHWVRYKKGRVCHDRRGRPISCVWQFLNIPAASADYYALRHFFNALGTCVHSDMCDYKMARDVFGNDVLTFYDDMWDQLQSEYRQGNEARGLLDFVDDLQRGEETETSQTSSDNSSQPVNTTPSQPDERRDERGQPSLYQRVRGWWKGS